MDVPVTELRAHLSEWLDRVRSGDEVVVTDRGIPVARLLGMSATGTLQRLAADGVIGRDVSVHGRPPPDALARPPAGPCPTSSATSDVDIMALVYFDSSALVKLVVEEPGSSLVAQLWDGCDAALASRLAYPEVRAALAAAARNHDLTDDDLRAAEQAWQEFWAATRPVELTPAVSGTPANSPRACAPGRRRRTPGERARHRRAGLIIAVWDRRLHAGALAAGTNVAPAVIT